ncbi:MAG: amidohydrolase family protein [Verrucomicrobiales bacterium]
MIIRARCVMPVSSPPIDNGAFKIKDGKTVMIGRYDEVRRIASGDVIDLQEVAVCPGLVNAHCHLDYTDMAGLLLRPRQFPDWIKAILNLKAHWSFTEYAKSWLNGAQMLLRSGTTTVADIEAAPELIPEVWDSTPLRVLSFFEMTGVKSNRAPADILNEAMAHQEKFAADDQKHQFALSPHAPYSTTGELLKAAAAIASEKNLLMSIHAAESESEFEMFKSGAGPFFDWLKSQRNMSDCGLGSPIEHLHRHGVLGPNTLVIHANYLTEGDVQTLARTRSSVVHCPRSHQYFGHRPFPWQALKTAGVNIALGTDSLATVLMKGKVSPSLDLKEEMLLFHQTNGASPEETFKMATMHGAKALKKEGQIGELKLGSFADFFSFCYSGQIQERKVLEHFLFENQIINDVFIGGQPVRGSLLDRFS